MSEATNEIDGHCNEDGCLLVAVDDHHEFGLFHAEVVLDRAKDSASDVQIGPGR